MAAKHPGVSKAISGALGKRPERGTLARLAEAVGVKAPTVSRWYNGDSSPDPSLWVAIEEHLDMHAGTLERAAGGNSEPEPVKPSVPDDPSNGALLDVLEDLLAVVQDNKALLVALAKRQGIPLPARSKRARAPRALNVGRRKDDRP